MRKIKRINAPRWWPIERKTKKFIITPRGAHAKEKSLPLLVLLRDVLRFVDNGKEAKSVIVKGEILVDGKKRKDPHYGIGLFDVVEIPLMNKSWRAIPKKGLEFIEIPKEESKLKLCKIVDKKTLSGNKTQLNLNDGKNILADNSYSTNDTILIEMPALKIVGHYKLEKESLAVVIGGKNSGRMARVKDIEKDRIWMRDGENTFEVPKDMVVVVGKDKPAIKIM